MGIERGREGEREGRELGHREYKLLFHSRNGVDIKISLSRFREESVCRGVSTMALTHNEHQRIVERGSHRATERGREEQEGEREEGTTQ